MKTSGNNTDLFSGYLNGQLKSEELPRLFEYLGKTDEPELRSLIETEMQSELAANSNSDELSTTDATYQRIIERIGLPEQPEQRAYKTFFPIILKYAASILMALGLTWLLWDQLDPFKKNIAWKEVATAYGRKKLVLPDGTNIWLAPKTTVQFPHEFSKDHREVRLNGEAFFEVKRDPKRPFTIHSGQLKTQVLGTSFNINAYSSELAARVTVVTGKVAVTAGSSQQVQLTANKQAFFDTQSGKLSERDYPDAGEMLRRRNGYLKYTGASLSEIIKDIQHITAYKITTYPGLGECIFYGEMNAGEDPLTFLENVCHVNNLSMLRKGQNQIVITGKGCRN